MKKFMNYEIEEDKKTRGNSITRNRYRAQSYTIDGDYPCESEWHQIRDDAVKTSAGYLIKYFEKHGKMDIVIKVFNEMNHNQKPIVITYEDALKIKESVLNHK